MANIFSNPWDEEKQRKLRSPFTGVRPYQPSLPPGGAYGQIWDGNTGMGMMPGPSTPPGGPAPLPPSMQTPSPRDPNNEYWTQDRLDKIGPVLDHTGNPAPGGMRPKVGDPVTTPMPTLPVYGGQNPDPRLVHPGIPQGPINLPGQGGGDMYSGAQWEGLDMSGFNPSARRTADMSPYTINGETYYGSSSWASELQEYLNSTGQGDAFGRPDMSIGFQQPRQGPPDAKWGDGLGPPDTKWGDGLPGGITPLPSPPNAGTGGPLPPGGPIDSMPMLPGFPGGPNRPSRPSNPPEYRLARPSPGIDRPNLPFKNEPEPFKNWRDVGRKPEGYNRAATSSSSPAPAWGVGKTKRKF